MSGCHDQPLAVFGEFDIVDGEAVGSSDGSGGTPVSRDLSSLRIPHPAAAAGRIGGNVNRPQAALGTVVGKAGREYRVVRADAAGGAPCDCESLSQTIRAASEIINKLGRRRIHSIREI